MMNATSRRFSVAWVLLVWIGMVGSSPVFAQAPPPESTSKVKRVLLYNFNGGWICADCRIETQKVFFRLAESKGFSLDTSAVAQDLTLEKLKQYQVIVWNNNHSGASSVPDAMARSAIAEYIRQGGGWLLVNIANNHANSWPYLRELIGPGTTGWRGVSERAVLVPDTAAQKHPELQFLVNAMPDSIPIQTNWLGVRSPIDDLHHIKVIYRLSATWTEKDPNLIPSYFDHYVWASTQDGGRALALPLGWYGGNSGETIMRQADSAVPKLYWQGLRWLAGDYQGGCTNPEAPNFDPEARVHDGSCAALGIDGGLRPIQVQVKLRGRRVYWTAPSTGDKRVLFTNVEGKSIGQFTVPSAAMAFDLPNSLKPGLYFLAVFDAKTDIHASVRKRDFIRVLIP